MFHANLSSFSFPLHSKGFSLLELLVVVAIIMIAMGLMIPAFSPNEAQQLRSAGHVLVHEMEAARLYAITHHTPVWVGLTVRSDDFSKALTIGSVASQTRDTLPSGTDPTRGGTDVLRISKPRHLKNVALATLPGDSSRPTPSVSLQDVPAGGSGGDPLWLVKWNAQGEAYLNDNQLYKRIEIGLRPSKDGASKSGEANYFAVQISGLTGSVNSYQPQVHP